MDYNLDKLDSHSNIGNLSNRFEQQMTRKTSKYIYISTKKTQRNF